MIVKGQPQCNNIQFPSPCLGDNKSINNISTRIAVVLSLEDHLIPSIFCVFIPITVCLSVLSMCSMELKQFFCNRSNEWIQDVLSHLSKSENEDLVRQTLEAHIASQPSRAEEEKQAYGWIQWAKHRKHLKVFVLRFANTSTLYVFVIFTVRNSSCGKVMFSQVSVCPQGGCIPPGRHPLGRPAPDMAVGHSV